MVVLSVSKFGTFQNKQVKKFTWKTDKEITISVISYGAIIQSIEVPNKYGVTSDITLGFDGLDDYVHRNDTYFGSTIGRCANRIRDASFEIDDITYNLSVNEGDNQLHGGVVGFNKVNWDSTVDGNKVIFSYLSKDGDQGYPGDLIANVTYEVRDENTLFVEYLATTTKKTIVNMTNHSYFNLAGECTGAEELFNHVITVNAGSITETDEEQIPTGRILPVAGTLYDLRKPTRLGDRIQQNPKLYDDNFCLVNYDKEEMKFVSRVIHPMCGRYLELYSNKPGVQVYTANNLPKPDEPALVGKGGVGYRQYGAFVLEPQDFPDAIHHPNFPSVILTPGNVYRHTVKYIFGVEEDEQPSYES